MNALLKSGNSDLFLLFKIETTDLAFVKVSMTFYNSLSTAFLLQFSMPLPLKLLENLPVSTDCFLGFTF